MANIDALVAGYGRYVSLPWQADRSGAERVWIVVYEPGDERRLRARIESFAVATKGARHQWRALDLTDAFARWMTAHEFREEYFASPEDLDPAPEDFFVYVTNIIEQALTAPDVDDNTIVAVYGLGSLYELTRVSRVVQRVDARIRGRMLVLFPGARDGSNYRLLDAHDGWNYLAIPITAA